MSIRADTLFTYDRLGRMLRTNEPDAHPAPRLFLGRTLGGHVVRFGATMPAAVARLLAAILEREPPAGALTDAPAARNPLRDVLERHAPIAREQGGPAYRFPESLPPPADVVQVTDANIEIVRDTYPWLCRGVAGWAPCFAVVRDGAAVSVCFSARIGTQACEAGVETLPDFRGRGYAQAVTAAWGAAIRRSGRIPLYSTSWENLASQGVAQRGGLVRFGADSTWW
jgi:RimJ/RimL family protein N-acetyltransferase